MATSKRKASGIHPIGLWDHLMREVGEDRYDLRHVGRIGKDLKVDFDFENCELEVASEVCDEWHGLRVCYADGGQFSFICVSAGGDWQHPVYFIIYLDKDHKTLRAYVPKNGNVWNHKTKQAIGEDEAADAAFLRKWAKKHRPEDWAQFNQELTQDDVKVSDHTVVDLWQEQMLDFGTMKFDIRKRFEVVEWKKPKTRYTGPIRKTY